MSNWSPTQLTMRGQALEAKVTAGTTTLVFTKMKLGSGNTTPGDIAAMTDLTAPEMVLGISSCAVSEADSTVCEVVSVVSSSDVVSSFAVRETGLFATDPDEGEILYAVSIDTVPDTMPNNTVASPVTVSYQMDIIAANVTAIINPAGLVTARILQAHNDSISAHKMSHWYRQNLKAYAVGDIAFSASLPSSLVLECTTAGTTAATEPDFSGAAEGNTVTDGEVVWTYKSLVGGGLDREQIPAFNKRDVITTSGTYTASVTGWYKITVKGGGSGGNAGRYANADAHPGAGGGEGGTTIGFEYMNVGDAVPVVIGGGGTGGTTNGALGQSGGNSSVVVNGNTYTGGGASNSLFYIGGTGGAGNIFGNAGSSGSVSAATAGNAGAVGGNGGGAGGGIAAGTSDGGNAIANSGGGGGGAVVSSSFGHGGNGGDGYVWFEYFAPSLN